MLVWYRLGASLLVFLRSGSGSRGRGQVRESGKLGEGAALGLDGRGDGGEGEALLGSGDDGDVLFPNHGEKRASVGREDWKGKRR